MMTISMTGRPARACQECREKKKRCTHRDLGSIGPVINVSKTSRIFKTRARQVEKELKNPIESPDLSFSSLSPPSSFHGTGDESEHISNLPGSKRVYRRKKSLKSKTPSSTASASKTNLMSNFPKTLKFCHGDRSNIGFDFLPQELHLVSHNYSDRPIPEIPEDKVEAACHMAIHIARARELERRLSEFKNKIENLGELFTKMEAAHQAGLYALNAVNDWAAVWIEGL